MAKIKESPKIDLADEILEIEDVAKMLKCSQATVYRRIKYDKLPMLKRGKHRILKSKLLEWVSSCPNVR